VELDLTANLGRNFRLRGNVARPRTKQTNTVPGLRAYFAQYSAEWRAGAADPANPNRAQIATDIASLETTMSNANEGRVLNNTPDYTASVFGMYSLAAGPLKGLRLGGGLVWQGPRIIGNQLNRAFDYIRSDSYRTANLSVGYTLRVGRRPIELQFNVTNLFDHADPIYSGTQTFGGQALRALHYYLDPRKAALAATSRF
jgi:outer membrane receptor for monomeric catechols